MDLSDVMIGNWVRYSDTTATVIVPTKIGRVLAINAGGLSFNPHEERWKHNDIVCSLIHCVGIELTPEILEKCGFGNIDNDEFHLNGIRLERGSYSHKDEFFFKWGYIKDRIYIKYIHQLQNLYYCLTGSHLEVKI